MASPGVEALLYLMDEAFEGQGIEESNESQALLTNLATVSEEQWQAKPPGAERTIACRPYPALRIMTSLSASISRAKVIESVPRTRAYWAADRRPRESVAGV